MVASTAKQLRFLSHSITRYTHARKGFPPSHPRYSSTIARQWSTPLAKSLAEAITTTGPISIANFMRQCLTSPEGGYYTTNASEGKDQFGKSGDFITSPEISQIFGELVGIWLVTEWMAQGRRSKGVTLIELGPGRGTLMDDVLRTIRNFKPMASSIETIYMVEASPVLRETQRKLLCASAPLEDHPKGYQSKSKHLPGVPIVWIEDLAFKPQEPSKTPFVIAHEFLDALPIHAFQSVQQAQSLTGQQSRGITTSVSAPSPPRIEQHFKPKNEWRELVVSPTPPPSVINPPKTPGPEFELTLSRAPTPYSRLLPTLSPRYANLLQSTGSTIEICPSARTTASNIAELIGGANTASRAAKPPTNLPPPPQQQRQSSGAALIIDYGPASTVPISTLRGIRAHTTCSPFSSPGLVDLSTDVDFGAVAEAALGASEGVEVHGPVEQADWLREMGGTERCDALVRKARASGSDKDGEEMAERLVSGWRRLVDRTPNGMGKLYKVMSVVPVSDGARRPVGFGGVVGE